MSLLNSSVEFENFHCITNSYHRNARSKIHTRKYAARTQVPSDVDMDESDVSDWAAEEKEEGEEDEDTPPVVWDSESLKDSFVPQIGDDVIYFPLCGSLHVES